MRYYLVVLLYGLLHSSPLWAVTLAGTGDSEILLKRLAAEYHRKYPDRPAVSVPESVGSSGGIRMLLQGRTDFARVARPLKPEEARQGLRIWTFARVPILFVANLPQPCVQGLDSESILDIVYGEITNWSQVNAGCPNHKLYFARREPGDSSTRVLQRVIPGFDEESISAGKTVYTTMETVRIIQEHPYTMGFIPGTALHDSNLTHLAYNGIKASTQTVADGRYPLLLEFSLVWKEPLSVQARQFMHYLQQSDAREIMNAFGAVATPGEGR